MTKFDHHKLLKIATECLLSQARSDITKWNKVFFESVSSIIKCVNVTRQCSSNVRGTPQRILQHLCTIAEDVF